MKKIVCALLALMLLAGCTPEQPTTTGPKINVQPVDLNVSYDADDPYIKAFLEFPEFAGLKPQVAVREYYNYCTSCEGNYHYFLRGVCFEKNGVWNYMYLCYTPSGELEYLESYIAPSLNPKEFYMDLGLVHEEEEDENATVQYHYNEAGDPTVSVHPVDYDQGSSVNAPNLIGNVMQAYPDYANAIQAVLDMPDANTGLAFSTAAIGDNILSFYIYRYDALTWQEISYVSYGPWEQ